MSRLLLNEIGTKSSLFYTPALLAGDPERYLENPFLSPLCKEVSAKFHLFKSECVRGLFIYEISKLLYIVYLLFLLVTCV